MSILTNLITKVGGTDKLIDSIAGAADEFVLTKEEKAQLRLELEKLTYSDRADAREMYENNSSLQKIYALAFLFIYAVLTAGLIFLVYKLVKNGFALPDWSIALMSSIWGGISAKILTITDFLFGSSKGSQDKNFLLK